ncbi:exosome complex protein LRP1 [Geosmithia morbida]|uniref:Exosome complex protein n=1 Tax=Geosmithia morbida TaxID=1094350 RepID=A0A9P4YZS4_9HYPO|nr:exosome complex protein LRP1 [Geosmithia morbida]KAF4124792.1 exosome complex protein LRP1 [Geosmithia morbida]
MADIKDITRDLNKLDSQLDGLEEVMKPLLSDLQEMSSQLPLLDKAKLFSLTAYAVESLLFCKPTFRELDSSIMKSDYLIYTDRLLTTASLKLQGADAQNHAVFTELKRIQQYFAKIKSAEQPEAQRNTTVNQEAAARMLRSDLLHLQADNKSISSKLAEKIAEERAKALLKSMENNSKKRPAVDSPQPSGGESNEAQQKSKKPKNKKGRKGGKA